MWGGVGRGGEVWGGQDTPCRTVHSPVETALRRGRHPPERQTSVCRAGLLPVCGCGDERRVAWPPPHRYVRVERCATPSPFLNAGRPHASALRLPRLGAAPRPRLPLHAAALWNLAPLPLAVAPQLRLAADARQPDSRARHAQLWSLLGTFWEPSRQPDSRARHAQLWSLLGTFWEPSRQPDSRARHAQLWSLPGTFWEPSRQPDSRARTRATLEPSRNLLGTF